jgi:hypothetical protein
MVTNCGQVCLFEKSEYVLSGKKSEKKRIHYKTPKFRKTYKNDVVNGEIQRDDITLYQQIKRLYAEIANYYPLPFGTTETVFDFGSVRVWKQEYNNDYYLYKGVRYCEVSDLFFEAEIIGTERMSVENRIKIHTELLSKLRQGITKEDIELWLQKKM